MLRIALGSFDSMPNFTSIQMSVSQDGNLSKSSSYHLLHGQLEWRWIYLITIYRMEKLRNTICDAEESELQTELILLVNDLVSLSLAKFQKCNNANVIFTSPILCSCVKELWLVLYDFIKKLNCDTMSFWKIVGKILTDLIENRSPYERYINKKILLRSSNRINCKNVDQFTIWFMSGLVKVLQNVQNDSTKEQSYDIYQNLLKNFLRIEQSEENLRIFLVIISEVIQDVWGKTDILMQLWEIFQKKINSPFFIVGQAPTSLAVSSVTAQRYLEKIKTNQKSITKPNPNSTSFDMFVNLLGKQVERLTSTGQRIQVQKILGRIYTKFPPSKLQTLNEMGIHNLLKLFLTLSISTNFADVAKKFSEILLQVPMEKPNNQQQIMKGHMAMLILYRENQMEISTYADKLMNLLNNLIDRCTSGLQASLKIIADALPIIISNTENDDNFENGEDRLIDVWIEKYLQSSTISEQDRVYEYLIKIVKKLRETKNALPTSNVVKLVQKMFTILLPQCKQNFEKSESTCLPIFSGYLCLLSNDFQELSIPKFEILFKTFLDVKNGNNIEHIVKFLSVVVENSTKSKLLDRVLVVQQWIKCSVLLSGSNSNMKELTRIVIKLDEFKFLSETARTQPEDFLNSKEPICVFLADIGKKYSSSSNNDLKFNLIDKLYSYLITFERWAVSVVNQQQQQALNQQPARPISQDEPLMRIYTFISVAFLHCSELIYVRSKPNCFFNIAVNQFLLPSSLMMGHQQSRAIVLSIFKVWPLLIDGVSRLNYKNDPHINKVLSDLIVRWAPLMKISSNSKAVARPFISLTNLKNPETVEFVFGKLAKSFIALQNRKPNQHSCLILTMIEEVLNTVEGDEKKVMMIWRESMLHVIEAAMMSDDNDLPSQMMSYNLLEKFFKNKNFECSSQMRALLVKSLQDITNLNLSYHSASYFK